MDAVIVDMVPSKINEIVFVEFEHLYNASCLLTESGWTVVRQDDFPKGRIGYRATKGSEVRNLVFFEYGIELEPKEIVWDDWDKFLDEVTEMEHKNVRTYKDDGYVGFISYEDAKIGRSIVNKIKPEILRLGGRPALDRLRNMPFRDVTRIPTMGG